MSSRRPKTIDAVVMRDNRDIIQSLYEASEGAAVSMSKAKVESLDELPDPKSLRVALFLDKLDGAGVPRVMLNLARGFRDLGVCVELIVGDASGVFRDQVPDGVEVHDLRVRRMSRALPRLMSLLRAVKPDILISAEDHSNLIAILARALVGGSNVKLAVTGHVRFERAGAGAWFNRGAWVLRLIRWLYPHADLVTTVSEGLAESMARATRFPRSQIRVIPNAVLSEEIFRLADEPVDHPWLDPSKTGFKTIVGVGRLSNAKNFALLLDALSFLPDVRALIVGEGPLRSNLEEKVRASGLTNRAQLVGFQKNPYKYMLNSDAFVLSSKFEGLPTVLIEALALGVPVVSTDCPHGPREIISNVGCGELVAPEDPKALAHGIRAALCNPTLPAVVDKMNAIYGPAAVAKQFLKALEVDWQQPGIQRS